MDDRYTMIDDEALEEARQRMEAFQRQRGLINSVEPADRIKELRSEIRRLESLKGHELPIQGRRKHGIE
jgi:hypothetical protein